MEDTVAHREGDGKRRVEEKWIGGTMRPGAGCARQAKKNGEYAYTFSLRGCS